AGGAIIATGIPTLVLGALPGDAQLRSSLKLWLHPAAQSATCLRDGEVLALKIGQYHMGTRMSDRDRQACLFQRRLCGCAAGPEYRQLIVTKPSETVPAIRSLKVHADHLRLTNMDRSPMEFRKTRGDLHCADRIGRPQASHRDDQFAAKFARGSGADVGNIHGRDTPRCEMA